MKEKIQRIWESVWIPETQENRHLLFTPLRHTFRLFYSATERFRKDEDLVRAASISYSIIVSFIPTLLVALILAANFINIKEYEDLAKEYVRKNGIPMDVEAYFKIVYELLNNTAALTGIGFLLVLFSTTAVLRNMEDSMNKIWHIQKTRPFIQKIAEFIMVVILGPILLAVGLTTGNQMLKEFSSPKLKKVLSHRDSEYILGDKNILIERKMGEKWKEIDYLDRVDYDFQKDTIVYDPETNTVLNEKELQPLLHRLKKASLSDTKNSSLQDIFFQNDSIYIITDNGTLLYTYDRGEYWMARKFQRKQLSLLTKASFQKIHFFNEKDGIIIGKSGLLLYTRDSGETWKPIYNKNIQEDLNDIEEIRPGEYLIVGDNYSAYYSNDQGRNWKPYSILMDKDNYDKESLNSISVIENNIYICGDSGAILTSYDSGKTWTKKNLAYRKYDFNHIFFLNPSQGILVGDYGSIRYTLDGGNIWKKAESSTSEELFYGFFSQFNQEIVLVGDNYNILTANSWENMNSFKVEKKTPFWRLGIVAFGRFFLPFSVLWIIFFLIYQIMPYTNVKFVPAAIGALCTSTALLVFIIGFQTYISYFSAGKFAIYGTLAAIPLALLILNVSTIFVLYGCEISYLVQHPNLIFLSYRKRNIEEMEKKQIWKGIQLIHRIHMNFMEGRGESTEAGLIKFCKISPEEMDRIIDVLIKNNYIARTENKGYVPVIAAEKVNLEMLIDILSPTEFDITDYDKKNILVREIKPIFQEYAEARKKIFRNRTLLTLLKDDSNSIPKS